MKRYLSYDGKRSMSFRVSGARPCHRDDWHRHKGCVGDVLLSYSNSFAQLFTMPSFTAYTFYNEVLTIHAIFLSVYLRAVSVPARYLGTAQRSGCREEVNPLAAIQVLLTQLLVFLCRTSPSLSCAPALKLSTQDADFYQMGPNSAVSSGSSPASP